MRELKRIEDSSHVSPQYAQEMARVGAIITLEVKPLGHTLNIGGQIFICGPEITREEFWQLVLAAGLGNDLRPDPPAHVKFQRVFTD